MNYQPVITGNQPNPSTGIQEFFDADKAGKGNVQQYVLFPLWSSGSKDPQNTNDDTTFNVKEHESEVYVSPSSSAKTKKHDDKTKREAKGKSLVELSTGVRNLSEEFEDFFDNSINWVNAASTPVPAVRQNSANNTNTFSAAGPSNTVVNLTLGKSSYVDPSQYPNDLDMLDLEDITYSDDEEDEELLQFKMQKVWVLMDLLKGKRAIGSKWVFRNKKDERGIVIRKKARLVAQGNTQEEGIDYEEVFTLVSMIEAIRLFLAYASFMGFMVYQMDVKSAFFYGTIKEEVYVYQPPGFEDPDYPDKVYKVVKALYRLHQAPRAWYETLVYVDAIIFGSTNKDLCKAFEKLMKDKFQMSSMGELTFFLGLQVKQKQDVIFISQDKYVAEILRKFGLIDGKSASTPIDTEKPLLKDPNEDEDAAEPTSPIPATTLPPPQELIPSTSQAIREKEEVESFRIENTEEEGKIDELDADEDVTLEEVVADLAKDAEDDEVEPAELKEVIEVVTTTKLMIEVVTADATTITAAPSAARRRKGVVIRDPEETATP
nr:putative ribonuclease H-like domain-containing protein [Tanacetum cinerariifolium]